MLLLISQLLALLVTGATIRRKRLYPQASYLLCALNVLLNPLNIFYKKDEIPLDECLQDAMKTTGLTKIADTAYLDYLKTMQQTKSQRELVYSNIGRVLAVGELKFNLARKLRFDEFMRNNPHIANIPVKSPVFVCGLGRSGTTFIHRLLSLDPSVRTPKLWQLVNFVPGDGINKNGPEMDADLRSREEYLKKRLNIRKMLGDASFEGVHEVGHDYPEECLFAMSNDIPLNTSMLYTDFIEGEEFFFGNHEEKISKAYLSYKKILQLLSFQFPYNNVHGKDGRWVLKCPLHLFWLPQLTKVFPDAKIVWAHRHPVTNFSSICGLINIFHGLYYEKTDNSYTESQKVNRRMYDIVRKVLPKAQRDIENFGIDCAHIVFEELVKDPITVVKEIYENFGWKYTDEYHKILKAYVAENEVNRKKTQKNGATKGGSWHSLDDGGVTEEELMTGAFADYIAKYKLPKK